MPAMWPTKARATMRPRPSASQRGPPKAMASVNPQNAAPLTQPTCSWLRLNWDAHVPAAPPLMAKLMAVTTRAIRLARKRRFAFMSGFSGFHAERLEIGDAGRDVPHGIRGLILDEVVLDARLAALGDDGRPVHAPGSDDHVVRGRGVALVESGRGSLLHVLYVKSLEAPRVLLEQLDRVHPALHDPEHVHLAEDQVGLGLVHHDVEGRRPIRERLELVAVGMEAEAHPL